MRDLFADIGIFYGKRRTGKQKERFIGYLDQWLHRQGLQLHAVRYRQHRQEAIHLVIGELEHAEKVVAVPYDTGSRVLLPFYKEHPLNVKKNAFCEMGNTLVYALLEILLLFLIVRVSSWFPTLGWPQRIALVLFDAAALVLCWKLLRHFDNRMNVDHYSQALTAVIKSASRNKGCAAYVLIDQSAAMESGYQQLAAMCAGKEVLLLQTLGNDQSLYLVHAHAQKKRAQTLKKECFPWAVLWEMEEEQRKKSLLYPFADAFLLVGADCRGKDLYVRHVRTGKDRQMNIERMEMVEKGISVYGR